MKTDTRILIIDDEPKFRETLGLILGRAGYVVAGAASAHEGEQLLRNGSFDLVFLDLRMPEISGLSFLPAIHQLQPDLPVLILTAHASLESALEAVRQGARDYLLKPVDPELILRRVSEITTEHQVTRRKQELVQGMRSLLKELHEIDELQGSGPDRGKLPQASNSQRHLQRGPFCLDLHARTLTLDGQMIPLSPTAFDYLMTLVRHAPNPVPFELLVAESQGYTASLIEAQQMARWRVHELRKAFEPDSKKPVYLMTVRGIGYRLAA